MLTSGFQLSRVTCCLRPWFRNFSFRSWLWVSVFIFSPAKTYILIKNYMRKAAESNYENLLNTLKTGCTTYGEDVRTEGVDQTFRVRIPAIFTFHSCSFLEWHYSHSWARLPTVNTEPARKAEYQNSNIILVNQKYRGFSIRRVFNRRSPSRRHRGFMNYILTISTLWVVQERIFQFLGLKMTLSKKATTFKPRRTLKY